MRAMGLVGAVRGRAWVTTTQAEPASDRPRDLVDAHVHGDAPESALGRGLHVRRHLARLRLRRVRHRRLRAPDCRLARVGVAARRTSSWTRSSRRSTTAVAPTPATWCITATAARSISRCATPIDSPTPAIEPSVGQPRRRVRQRPRRIGDRAVQDGGDSTPRPVAASGGGGTRDADVGRLVQHPPAARADRRTCRRRSIEARYYEQAAVGLTHTNSPSDDSRYDSRCPQRR